MVYRRRGRARKSNRPIRRRVNRRVARSRMFNPCPVFTESFALPSQTGGAQYILGPNSGGVLSVTIDDVPQIAQYNTLYQKYRILKAKFICIPTHNTASADVNAQLPAGGMLNAGLSRVVYAINDSPAQTVLPGSEAQVLEDNGCRIVCGSPKLVMSCRPVPNTNDALGNQMTFKNKYLNFHAGFNQPHFGITWWHSQPVLPGGAGYGVPYLVYCKLTFQLSDPR